MSNKKKKREYLSMSDQHLADQEKMWDMMEELRERRRAKNLGYTRWRTKNQGGMMNINRMTAPLGYALGGPAGMTEPERKSAQPVTMSQIMGDMEASEDIRLPGKSFSSIVTERQPVNPYHDLTRSNLERGKELGKKGLEGIRSLFGAKEAGAGEALDELISKRAMLISQINGEMMYGDDETLKNLMNEYKRLDNMIRTIQLQTFTGE